MNVEVAEQNSIEDLDPDFETDFEETDQESDGSAHAPEQESSEFALKMINAVKSMNNG